MKIPQKPPLGVGGPCQHPEDNLITKVVGGTVNCETTRTQCTLCKEFLTEPETDCR